MNGGSNGIYCGFKIILKFLYQLFCIEDTLLEIALLMQYSLYYDLNKQLLDIFTIIYTVCLRFQNFLTRFLHLLTNSPQGSSGKSRVACLGVGLEMEHLEKRGEVWWQKKMPKCNFCVAVNPCHEKRFVSHFYSIKKNITVFYMWKFFYQLKISLSFISSYFV